MIQQLTAYNIASSAFPVVLFDGLIYFSPAAFVLLLLLWQSRFTAMHRQQLSLLLRIAMFLLSFIGMAMMIRRTLTIAGVLPVVSPKGAAPFDTGFGQHPLILFLHMLPGFLFMLLGPWQFMPRIRHRYPRFHRISGSVVIVCGYITGISALCLPFLVLPIGGINEAAASTLYGIVFLVSLTKAVLYIRRHNIPMHREWMIRAFAIGLAVSTVRPIVGIFFAFSGLTPQAFFGTAFWLGFTLHLLAAEIWINYTSPSANLDSGNAQ